MSRTYTSHEQFFSDLDVMVENAMAYNEDESEVHRDALQIRVSIWMGGLTVRICWYTIAMKWVCDWLNRLCQSSVRGVVHPVRRCDRLHPWRYARRLLHITSRLYPKVS